MNENGAISNMDLGRSDGKMQQKKTWLQLAICVKRKFLICWSYASLLLSEWGWIRPSYAEATHSFLHSGCLTSFMYSCSRCIFNVVRDGSLLHAVTQGPRLIAKVSSSLNIINTQLTSSNKFKDEKLKHMYNWVTVDLGCHLTGLRSTCPNNKAYCKVCLWECFQRELNKEEDPSLVWAALFHRQGHGWNEQVENRKAANTGLLFATWLPWCETSF